MVRSLGESHSYGKTGFRGPEYDVFLSFRGRDTRHGFIDFLYEFMTDAGVHVFLDDDEEFHLLEEMGDRLDQAIGNCRIYMPVFSKNYASSTWCLKELTRMVDLCESAAAEKMMLPIFYDVEPYDIQLRNGLYWTDLDKHKKKYAHEIVQKWEEALIRVGRTGGWSLKDCLGVSRFRRLVVQDVLDKLKIMNRSFPKHLVGIEDQSFEIMKLLNCDSPQIRCVAVHGMGGIGKTTLASTIFNRISSHFDGCSFLSDMRKSSQSKEDILKLQKKLFDDIFRSQHISMLTNGKALAGVTDEIDEMKRRLYGKSVLIVLDDLDKNDQLTRLLGNCDWLGPRTRIIITTTDKSVGSDGWMIPQFIVNTYEMKELTDNHAIQLFSRHAFGKDKPLEDHVVTSKQILRAVGNLPLALEVIGGHLYGETKEVWEYTLTTLEEALDKQTKELSDNTSLITVGAADKRFWEVLLISYKGLNDREKEFFLDIARRSSELPWRYASYMWGNMDNESAVLTLARKSLIKFMSGMEIWMHDLIRELGGQMLFLDLFHKFYGMIGRLGTNYEDAILRKRRKLATASGIRGMPEVPELTSEHHRSAYGMAVDIGGPSTDHADQTSLEGINWEVEMEEGDEESSAALVRSPGKARLASDELLIGIQHKVEAVVELMNVDSDGIGIIGICGSDGYGKTTLAKAVCSQVSPQFEAICFLEDIREAMRLPGGIQSLQNKLTRDIQMRECGEDEGAPLLKIFNALSESELPHTKVLIVLDDIKDFSYIKELIGDKLRDRFGRGSRIIVTARGNHVEVENLGGDWVTIYHISEMSADSALRLFSHHAFGRDSLAPGYRGIAETIVSGLKMCPLMIEIVGSLLRGKRSDEFKRMSKSIEPLAQGFQDLLRMSYNALDDVQKQIFLDITGFVGSEDIRTAVYMWHECLQEYPDRFLMPHAKVGKDNRLRMHSSIRHLGREIVLAGGSAEHSGMCSRLFVHQNAAYVSINRKVTANVDALWLNFGDRPSEELDDKNEEAFVKLTKENFRNMPLLRFLGLDSANIVGDFSDVFLELRWLRWRRCPKDFEATNVNMESLAILDVSRSALTENWGGWELVQMVNLKVLILAHCAALLTTPLLSGFPKLERLILEGCSLLGRIDSTIGILKHLEFLNLKFCRGLRRLPRELGDLEALRELLIDGTRVEEIPEIDKLGKLEILSSANCILLACLPESVGKLENLRFLTLTGCWKVQKLPDNMGGLGRSLVELDISGTGVIELPSSIASLESLKVLRMDSCHVTELPSAIGSLLKLEEIHASRCRNLEGIASEIGELRQLRILELRYAGISSLPKSVKNLGKLEILDLLHCDKLKQLPKLPSGLKLLHVNSELQQEIQFA